MPVCTDCSRELFYRSGGQKTNPFPGNAARRTLACPDQPNYSSLESAPLLLCPGAGLQVLIMVSTSKTQPPQVPPLTCCRGRPEARVIGKPAVVGEVGWKRSRCQHFVTGFYPKHFSFATHQVDTSHQAVSIDDDLNDVAVSDLGDGPPGQRLGPIWPMQAPVETPENRASVTTAMCFPKERCFRAEVIW